MFRLRRRLSGDDMEGLSVHDLRQHIQDVLLLTLSTSILRVLYPSIHRTAHLEFRNITVKMGISYSTARYLAPASFLIDFAAQNYGMLSTPNMKDIHDQNMSFFSPQPYFIAGFFFPQQLFQVGWLYRLWKLDESKPEERRELDQMVDFVPYYSLGNLCIAGTLTHLNTFSLVLGCVVC